MAKNKKDISADKSEKDNIYNLNEHDKTLQEVSFSDDSESKNEEVIDKAQSDIEQNSNTDLDGSNTSIENQLYGSKKEKRKKKDKKPHVKTTFSHKMRVFCTLLFLGVFTGSGLGVWYFNVNLKSPDYGSLSAESYIKPIGTVLLDNFGNEAEKDQKNWLNYVGNKTPNDISSHVDNFLLSVHNATLAKNFLFTGNGKATTLGITQTVYSQRRFNGDYYTFESISKGTITVANLDVYLMDKKNPDIIDIYVGKNVTQRNADWYYNRPISTDEYKNMTGGLPSEITPYIISEKTILSSSMTKDEETGNYIITFNLDPMTSVLNYYKEVRRTGGLEADPSFYSIKYIATIDDEWNLITTEVFESYKAVKFGMGVTCNGTIKIDYDFNLDEVIMPTLKGK